MGAIREWWRARRKAADKYQAYLRACRYGIDVLHPDPTNIPDADSVPEWPA